MHRRAPPIAAASLLLLIGIAESLPPRAAWAVVVVRHDKEDAETVKLGARFSAVGRVLPDGGCTLIAPTWVATAAHVAAGLRQGAQVQFGEAKYDVKRSVIHPEGAARDRQPPEVDLALLELGKAVDGVEPVALYKGKAEAGATLYIVGYGDFGNPGAIHHSDGRRRAVTNVVDDAGPKRLFMRFDAPPAGTAMEGVGAAGDSGGPALLKEKDKLFLAGVSSGSMDGKPGQYGVVDVYTRVGSYVEWIEGILKPPPAASK